MSNPEEQQKQQIEKLKAEGFHPLDVFFSEGNTARIMHLLREAGVKVVLGPSEIGANKLDCQVIYVPIWLHALLENTEVEKKLVGVTSKESPRKPEDYEVVEGDPSKYQTTAEASHKRLTLEEIGRLAASEKDQVLLIAEVALRTKNSLFIDWVNQNAEMYRRSSSPHQKGS